jgi:hypothetical protein
MNGMVARKRPKPSPQDDPPDDAGPSVEFRVYVHPPQALAPLSDKMKVKTRHKTKVILFHDLL